MSAAMALGFADPAIGSQKTFRAIMNALAQPGTIQALPTRLAPPAPLTPELAAVALTLADHEASLWLDEPLAEGPGVKDYLRFHTGAALVEDASEAVFALIRDPARLPSFDLFAIGVPEYPDRSTTLVCAVQDLSNSDGLLLEGPGILEQREFMASPLPDRFHEQLARNASLFPLGLDFVFVAPGRIAGLPRTARVVAGAA